MGTLQVRLGRVGEWTEERAFTVSRDHLRAYAASINDDHPPHSAGAVAHPLFAAVPIGELIDLVVDMLVTREDRRWGLHRDQDVHFYGPIVPGLVLRTRAAAVGAQPALSGSGSILVIKTETRHDGRLLNEAYVTLFFRRKFEGQPTGIQVPDHRLPAEARASAQSTGEVFTVTQRLDEDQTHRYADASGDRNPIHLDPEFARSVGLPGIIVHGMCTMALASHSVIRIACQGDPDRLRRLAVRFSRPVLPGQEITSHIWAAGERDARRLFGFETLNAAGKAVIQDGLAEVA